MKNGKKSLAYKIIYRAMRQIKKKTKKSPLFFLRQAIRILNPGITIIKRQEGGPVITELGLSQGKSIAIKWLLRSARKRSDKDMVFNLSSELIDVTKGSGYAIHEKEKTLRIAESNRTFAYY
uniref:30S ribosomal protein S7, chloroplastic n=1 Tax=Gastrodia javanica TaxID=2974003 RepID=A0A976YGD7_9ASPA|nr:ribosomal protein S7 [Gastrodia javanica]UVG40900.1 ribosomal protein S7 [Gastrodia javanica]